MGAKKDERVPRSIQISVDITLLYGFYQESSKSLYTLDILIAKLF